ncbi:MAG: hypothetical protein M3198_15410 [Actinomycetota bacterium]|nr:hypothetical protein [Actinomycetota bacterium]
MFEPDICPPYWPPRFPPPRPPWPWTPDDHVPDIEHPESLGPTTDVVRFLTIFHIAAALTDDGARERLQKLSVDLARNQLDRL